MSSKSKFPRKLRPPKIEYYLGIAKEVAARSTCYRNRMGSIIVRDDQIIATGYIGAPRKTRDCFERRNCLRTVLAIPHGHRYEICRSVHAEQNAIINAARAGVSTLGGIMYVWAEDAATGNLIDANPCFICKRLIINAGLSEVVIKTKKGMKAFKVENWAKEWQLHDIIDDRQQYGNDRQLVTVKYLQKSKRK